MFTAADSPFRNPPRDFSRRQILLLDGIRYSAHMAKIASERLFALLQDISLEKPNDLLPNVEAMMYAWSIVDSAHRYRDFILGFPGLKKKPWRRLLQTRTDDVAVLRNCVQHQLGEIENIVNSRGQLWGYLSWAEMRANRYTGRWLMLNGGSHYSGDSWVFAGPVSLPFRVPPGRIRLHAFGHEVYLGRTVEALLRATSSFSLEITSGSIRAEGQHTCERLGTDMAFEAFIQVVLQEKRDQNMPY